MCGPHWVHIQWGTSEQLWPEEAIDFEYRMEHSWDKIFLDFAENRDAWLYSTTSGCRCRMKSLKLCKPVATKAKLQYCKTAKKSNPNQQKTPNKQTTTPPKRPKQTKKTPQNPLWDFHSKLCGLGSRDGILHFREKSNLNINRAKCFRVPTKISVQVK